MTQSLDQWLQAIGGRLAEASRAWWGRPFRRRLEHVSTVYFMRAAEAKLLRERAVKIVRIDADSQGWIVTAPMHPKRGQSFVPPIDAPRAAMAAELERVVREFGNRSV